MQKLIEVFLGCPDVFRTSLQEYVEPSWECGQVLSLSLSLSLSPYMYVCVCVTYTWDMHICI